MKEIDTGREPHIEKTRNTDFSVNSQNSDCWIGLNPILFYLFYLFYTRGLGTCMVMAISKGEGNDM